MFTNYIKIYIEQLEIIPITEPYNRSIVLKKIQLIFSFEYRRGIICEMNKMNQKHQVIERSIDSFAIKVLNKTI